MNQMTLREVAIGNAVLTIFFAGFLALLSVKVGFDGWARAFELCVTVLIFNIISCLVVIVVNRPIVLFYFKEVVINSALTGLGCYIVFTETIPEKPYIFLFCLACVIAFYAFCIFSYISNKRKKVTPNTETNATKPHWFGIAGSLGASFQIFSSDNGILLLTATISIIYCSVVAAAFLRLGIKRRWGKAVGAWNEV